MGLTMKVTAGILLAEDGSIPRRYAEDSSRRSTLTKRFKQARPGALGPSDFADFKTSVPTLLGELLVRARARRGGGPHDAQALAALLAHVTGTSSQAMVRSLANYGLAASAYVETLDAIEAAPLPSERIRLEFALMLFVATGCLSDADAASRLVSRCARRACGESFECRTEAEGHVGAPCEEELCLLRITGKNCIGFRHLVPPTERGCMIGSAPVFDGPVITDVDASVSASHLRVWRSQGRWYVQGQESEAGTVLIHEDGTRVVVEPPLSDGEVRSKETLELRPGDTLALGGTVFQAFKFEPGR